MRVDQIVFLFDCVPPPVQQQEIIAQLPFWCHGRAPLLKVIPFRCDATGWRAPSREGSSIKPDQRSVFKDSCMPVQWYQDIASFTNIFWGLANAMVYEELMTKSQEDLAHKERADSESRFQSELADAFKADQARSPIYRAKPPQKPEKLSALKVRPEAAAGISLSSSSPNKDVSKVVKVATKAGTKATVVSAATKAGTQATVVSAIIDAGSSYGVNTGPSTGHPDTSTEATVA